MSAKCLPFEAWLLVHGDVLQVSKNTFYVDQSQATQEANYYSNDEWITLDKNGNQIGNPYKIQHRAVKVRVEEIE